MPTYSNIHAHLDNSEIHPPRDFSIAQHDSFLGKSPGGQLIWNDTYWQRPIKNLVDGGLEPPTPVHGDRYVLLNMGTTTFCGTALHDVVVSTTVDGTAVDTTVQEPYDVYGVCSHAGWTGAQLNDIVEYFAVDNDGVPLNKWMAVTPRPGYIANDLTDEKNWRFDGTTWEEQMIAEAPNISFAESLSYADMQALMDAGSLRKGEKYWINDKKVLLEAVNRNTLSTEGDHTREIKAYATIDITVATSGSVDSILANGTELLASLVVFNTDLSTTANDVVAAINSGTGGHGYTAKNALSLIIVYPPAGLGATANTYTIAATTTGITTVTSNFVNGQNEGKNWFRVRYRFAEDAFVEMSDNKGNHVIQSLEATGMLGGHNPINEFPWGYNNVFGNQVINGALNADASTGTICNNMVYGFMNADGFSSAVAMYNNVSPFSNFSIKRVSGYVISNTINLGATVTFDGSPGTFVDNSYTDNYFTATNFTDHFEHNIVKGSLVNISNATGGLAYNTITDATFSAIGASCQVSANVITPFSAVTLDGASGSGIRNNAFEDTTVDMTNFSGTFQQNRVNGYQLSAVSSSANINKNQMVGTGQIVFDNCTSSIVENNDIHAASGLDATGASGKIETNNIFASSIDLRNFSGDHCSQNYFHIGTLKAHNCSGIIEGNQLNNGTIEAEGASGAIGTNRIEGYSKLYLNNFNGVKFTGCEMDNSSIITANNNSSDSGDICINHKSNLDISSSPYNVDGCHIRVPYETIKFGGVVVNGSITKDYSNYFVQTTIDSSGALDFGLDSVAFAGIIGVLNSGTLSVIKNLDKAPQSFVLKNLSGGTITIDSTSSINITLPTGVITANLANNDSYILITKNFSSTNALVSQINLF